LGSKKKWEVKKLGSKKKEVGKNWEVRKKFGK
jgi:hypothetical protein